MARESNNYWIVIAAVLLLGAAVWFLVGNEANPRQGGVVLRTASPVAAPPIPDAAPAASAQPASSEVQRMINSGQFAPPPGNPEKMYSIASPFSAPAPAASGARGNGSGDTAAQPGMVMLGANGWRDIPAQTAGKNPAARAEIKPDAAAGQVHNQPIEFETPPGIGSAKGSQ